MLTLLRGAGPSAEVYARKVIDGSKDVISIRPLPWRPGDNYNPANGSIRSLLAQLRFHFGAERFNKIIDENRVAASFFLDGVHRSLSADEVEEYEKEKISRFSHLSHNWFTAESLIKMWAGFLDILFAQKEFTVVIPDLAATNGTFVAVLRKMFIEFDVDKKVHYIIGFDIEGGGLETDSRGVQWRVADSLKLFNDFASFDDTVVKTLDRKGTALGPRFDYLEPENVLDSRSDLHVYKELGNEAVSDELLDDACEILQWIFAARDFSASLKFGLRLCDHIDKIDTPKRSGVYGTVALSAHNRQFESGDGNKEFNHFLLECLERALSYEEDAIRRAAIGYRIGVTLARRQKEPAKAIRHIDTHLEDLAKLPMTRERAYHEAWLLNIRSYASMLCGDKERAAVDVEGAFSIAEENWNRRSDATRDEIFSAHVFAGNRSALALYDEDRDNLDKWFGKGTALFAEHWNTDQRYVRYLTMIMARNDNDLNKAVAAGREGLADAMRARSAEYIDIYSLNLAELYYRKGQLETVKGYIEAMLENYQKINEERRRLPAILLLAAVHLRSGDLEDASYYYREAESLVRAQPTALADIMSARAVVAALQGEIDHCEHLMDSAIDAAALCSERDSSLLVVSRAGEVFALLGDDTQAVDAFRRAVEIADPDANEKNLPPAAYLIRSWLGLYKIEGDTGLLRFAVSSFPRALQEGSDAWWELPKLLGLLDTELFDSFAESLVDEMAVLRFAATQRLDCQDRLKELVGH